MEAAKEMPEDERLFFAAYLKHLSRVDSPEYKKELSRLTGEFAEGKSFTMEQVQRLHENLSKEGL
jgi:hypothetical protein